MTSGVGPVTARNMVEQYGTSILSILDSPSAATKLAKCRGIGSVIASTIKKDWDESRGRITVLFVHDVMTSEVLLASSSVSFKLSVRTQQHVRPYEWQALEMLVHSSRSSEWGGSWRRHLWTGMVSRQKPACARIPTPPSSPSLASLSGTLPSAAPLNFASEASDVADNFPVRFPDV